MKANWRQILGSCVMICGMGISLYLLISQIGFCADMWKNDYKAQVFDTFLSYFFSVSKGIVLISVGIAFFALGAAFLCWKRK